MPQGWTGDARKGDGEGVTHPVAKGVGGGGWVGGGRGGRVCGKEGR